jgi:signal transduction histidine kinase
VLSANSIDYSDRIYVNNEWRLEVGSPGLTKAESIPGSRYIKFEVEAFDGVIDIIRQSSNFVHMENSAYAGFWIGNPENMSQMIALQELPASIIIGLYLALSVIHLIIWLLFRGYRPNIWFSLLCLAGLINSGFIGRKVFNSMFPYVQWSITYKVNYIAISLTGILILLLINDEFQGLVQKWVLHLIIAAYTSLTVIFIFANTVFISKMSIFEELLFALAAVYLVVRFIWILRKKEWRNNLHREHNLTLIGVSIALGALVHDVLYYHDIHLFTYYEIADIGTLTFVLFQTTAMLYATLRNYFNIYQETDVIRRKAERLTEKTNFYLSMSHELLTPLTRVSTNVQTAINRPEEAKDRLIDSQSEIMNMADIIKAALDDKEDDI